MRRSALHKSRVARNLTLACALAGLLATSAIFAQTNPVAEAQDAARALEAAATALGQVRNAEDRVAALAATIRAYEDGLEGLRAGLRQATIRERVIETRLRADETRLADLLGALQMIGRTPAPVMLAHPDGPVGSARAGMMLAEVAPALQVQAQALRGDLEGLQLIRQTRAAAISQLEGALTEVQQARVALSEAVSARAGNIPLRASPATLRALVDNAATLDAFAEGLAETSPNDAALPDAAIAGFTAAQGQLPLPVRGTLLHGFNGFDQAGIERPGWVLATAPGALVAAPSAATLRYAGPLLDYGNVIVLEPQSDYLIVMAGLGTLYGHAGEIVQKGAPLGLMGGIDVPNRLNGGGQTRRETLYLELRHRGQPIDPAPWFARDRD